MTQRRLGILLSILVIACSDGGTEPEPPATGPAGLRITPDDPVLRLGESILLDVEFVDASNRPVSATGDVTWSSSETDVVSVDGDGLLLAHAFGSATITARAGSLSASVEATVQTPAAEVGANTPVSAVIDTAGGLITATAADGTRYTLSIPRYALSKATTITLTPLASIGGFPTESGASAAVQFEPDGLTFTRPAELTIVAPAAFAAPTVAFSQSGAEFLLAPAAVHGDTARIMVGHFSSAGTTAPTPEETAALAASGTDAENTARHGVAQELNRAAAAGEHPDPDVIEQYMKAWFEDGVLPALEGAIAGTTDTEAALGEWLRWWGDMQLWTNDRLEPEIDSARTLALAALRAEIDRLNERCAADNEPSLVYDILHFAGLAALFGFDEVDPSLSLSAIFADLCMQIVIDATLADPFVDGSTLEVRAGMSVGGRAAEHDVPLDIHLTSSTVTFSETAGTTDGSGRFTSEISLRAGESDVIIDIEAANPLLPGMRAVHRVSAAVEYELEFTVDGGTATAVETGEQAWLNIFLQKAGAPIAAPVTLAIIEGGGSIDQASVTTDDGGVGAAVYTAPDEPDTVRVVARYVEGGRTLTDTVTIDVFERPKGRVAIGDIYNAWGVQVVARQSGVPTARDGRDVWIFSTGPLSGGYTASASAGSASASGSAHHDGSVEPGDTSVLLTVRSMGDAEGSASADASNRGAGATSVGGSDMHVIFEVLDEPVYYEISADGVRTGAAGSEVILTTLGPDRTVIFQKVWHASPDSLVTSGWLAPGAYSFDAAGSVMMGAGSSNTELDRSTSGSMAYRVLFRILEDEPKQEEEP